MARKKLSEYAVEHLRQSSNPAVMTGDDGLLHEIATKAGRKSNPAIMPWTEADRIFAALWQTPGELVRGCTVNGRNQRVRILRLPETQVKKRK
jgi:hypothetical protein